MSCKKLLTLKKMSFVLTSLLILIVFSPCNCFAFCEPGDSYDNPIVIDSLADLEILAQDVNEGKSYQDKYIILDNDIAIGNDNEPVFWESIGNSNLDSNFDGTFDGNGHNIKCNICGFSTNSTNSLFGIIGENGSIKNLNVSGKIATNNDNAVASICHLNYGTINNCTTDTTLVSSGPASSIAFKNYGKINDCLTLCKLLTDNEYCAGITIKNNGLIKNCSVNVNFQNIKKTNNSKIAGITIFNNDNINNCIVVTNIENSYENLNSKDLDTSFLIENTAAGICYINNGKINDCSFIGDISSIVSAGIAGINNSFISDCNVSSNIKGFIASGISAISKENGEIKNCYCIANVYSSYLSGNIIALNENNSNPDNCVYEIKIIKKI